MFTLKFQKDCEPLYMTTSSAGADLRAREPRTLEPGKVVAVPSGVWIKEYHCQSETEIYELQIRARSGLAFKYGITLANGVGTIDADYRDEIGVLLLNTSSQAYQIERGERIAQIVLNKTYRISTLAVGGLRKGGFGSTGSVTQ